MSDKDLLIVFLHEIEEAIRRRFSSIGKPEDFLKTDECLDRLYSIAMMLMTIGESIKRIDKITDRKMLKEYPGIEWRGVKGIRNILARDYFNIDAEEIYEICKTN